MSLFILLRCILLLQLVVFVQILESQRRRKVPECSAEIVHAYIDLYIIEIVRFVVAAGAWSNSSRCSELGNATAQRQQPGIRTKAVCIGTGGLRRQQLGKGRQVDVSCEPELPC